MNNDNEKYKHEKNKRPRNRGRLSTHDYAFPSRLKRSLPPPLERPARPGYSSLSPNYCLSEKYRVLIKMLATGCFLSASALKYFGGPPPKTSSQITRPTGGRRSRLPRNQGPPLKISSRIRHPRAPESELPSSMGAAAQVTREYRHDVPSQTDTARDVLAFPAPECAAARDILAIRAQQLLRMGGSGTPAERREKKKG